MQQDPQPIEFRYDIEGWRPSWSQMLDIVERYCHEDETAEELRWLRAHPTDWLMTARYMRVRTEAHVATDRKGLKDIQVVDPDTGRTRFEYLQAKRNLEKLNKRRLHWMGHLDEQIHEAKYLLGWEKIPDDVRAQLVDQLLSMRIALISEFFELDDVLGMLGSLIKKYGDPDFDPDAYRPR